jgi:integration host factor subunit alpha
MTLTKADIVDALPEKLGLPRNRCAEIVETLLEIMKQTMENGEDILISGFGKFCVNEKKARKGRNPATGEPMMLSKRRVVVFRCSNILREKVNSRRS